MDIQVYQNEAAKTAVFPPDTALAYTALGLCNETGEYAGKLKKSIRGDALLDKEAASKELGDVLWYVAACSSALGISLAKIAQDNLDKLADRNKRGVIKGNGDER